MKLLAIALVVATTALTVDDRAKLGVEIAYTLLQSKPAPPAPTPAGDACIECNGVGKVGDGVIMLTCEHCGGTGKEPAAKPVDSKPAPKPAAKPVSRAISSGPTWDWQGKMNPSTSEMIRHLSQEHGIVPSSIQGMSRSDLRALHDSLHNSTMQSAPRRTTTRSCPTGTCPIR